jgi:hypothetical protein
MRRIYRFLTVLRPRLRGGRSRQVRGPTGKESYWAESFIKPFAIWREWL